MRGGQRPGEGHGLAGSGSPRSVVVGGVGKRLFEDGNPLTKLRLVDSRTTPGGLVILTYGRA